MVVGLLVSNLHPERTEEIFSSRSTVTSARRSQQAIDALRGSEHHDQKLHVYRPAKLLDLFIDEEDESYDLVNYSSRTTANHPVNAIKPVNKTLSKNKKFIAKHSYISAEGSDKPDKESFVLMDLLLKESDQAMTQEEEFEEISSRHAAASDEKGTNIAHLATHAEAQQSIVALHDSTHPGQKPVERCDTMAVDDEKPQGKLEQGFTDVYVNHLDPSITLEQLKELFSSHGTVNSAKIDKQRKARFHYAIIRYTTHAEAQQAIDALHGSEHHGRKLVVRRTRTTAEQAKVRRSFITILHAVHLPDSFKQVREARNREYFRLQVENLHPSVTREKLQELFIPHGVVNFSRIYVDEEGNSLGFGTVDLRTPMAAQQVIDALHDSDHLGQRLVVRLSKVLKTQGVAHNETTTTPQPDQHSP
ncbi:hypothetical protein C0991_011483 [Blastosporella zonata]|nr:hypothetical protein C0991_011483 [Blastosporella zonata]